MQMFADFYKLSYILSSLVLWTRRANESNSKKTHWPRFSDPLGLTWPTALSVALLKIRETPVSKHEIILLELMFGRPMNSGLRPYPMPNLTESSHNHSILKRDSLLPRNPETQSHENLEEPPGISLPSPSASSFNVYKSVPGKDRLSPHWEGHFQVLLITHKAIQVKEKIQVDSCFP